MKTVFIGTYGTEKYYLNRLKRGTLRISTFDNNDQHIGDTDNLPLWMDEHKELTPNLMSSIKEIQL